MILLPDCFKTIPLAHRALHDVSGGIVENSLGAVLAAIRHGYGVELDIQLSADGEAIVFHDDETTCCKCQGQERGGHRFVLRKGIGR